MTTTALMLALSLGGSAEKPALAVLYFDNNTKSEELEVMRKGLADMMVTDLVAWDGVTVVEREKLEAVIGELKLQRTKYFDQSTATKIGSFLQAKYLLTGSMQLSGKKLILDAKLIDTKTNKIVVTARQDGPQDDVFAIEQGLVDQLTTGIDIKVKNEPARRRAKVPSMEALLAYSKAVDLSDQGKVEEAEKAFSALVSKSPTFLMARERKEAVMKALADYKKTQKEIITSSAVRVAKACDDALKKEVEFEKLPRAEQAYVLAMRRVKGYFLGRVLKQYLSSREATLKLVLRSKKKEALEAMRAWYENQLRYIDETTTFAKSISYESAKISPELLNDLKDSGLAPYDVVPAEYAFFELMRFIFDGQVNIGVGASGDTTTVSMGPTYADLNPEEAKNVWKRVDERVAEALNVAATASAAERDLKSRAAIAWLDQKAEHLARLERDDEAVTALQTVLDSFPTDSRNAWREEQIKKLIGGAHDNTRDKRERWLKGLQTCADMDLRVGVGVVADSLQRHQGIDGIDAVWGQLTKACPVSEKTQNVYNYIANSLALDAARADECELSAKYWKLYVAHGGSISDMLGYHKNYVNWCNYGEIVKAVQWFKFTLNRDWTPEVDQALTSIKSYDGKQLAISGRNTSGTIDVALYLVPEGQGWKCKKATWRPSEGSQVEGPCSVTLSAVAREKGEFDEGTFSASFVEPKAQPGPMKVELTEGSFKVRRQ